MNPTLFQKKQEYPVSGPSISRKPKTSPYTFISIIHIYYVFIYIHTIKLERAHCPTADAVPMAAGVVGGSGAGTANTTPNALSITTLLRANLGMSVCRAEAHNIIGTQKVKGRPEQGLPPNQGQAATR